MTAIALLFALTAAAAAFQDGPDDPVCAADASLCRVVRPFDIRVGATVHPVAPTGLRPWIQEGRLTLFPGESVVLVVASDGALAVESVARAEDILKDDALNELAAVFGPGGAGEHATEDEVVPGKTAPDMAVPPANRLRITFRQTADGDDMMLVVQNGFGDPVLYNAGMLVPGQGGPSWSATSVCTVMPGILAFEHWPHPILAVSLGDFHIEKSPTPDTYRCA